VRLTPYKPCSSQKRTVVRSSTQIQQRFVPRRQKIPSSLPSGVGSAAAALCLIGGRLAKLDAALAAVALLALCVELALENLAEDSTGRRIERG
jgi:hypothetical protein